MNDETATPTALMVMNRESQQRPVFGPEEMADVRRLVRLAGPVMTADEVAADLSVLADVEILLASWGCVKIDADLLAAAPKLAAVFYAAGTIRRFATDAMWDRGVRVCSAWRANAVPVAEFTVSQIIFCLKRGYAAARLYREGRAKSPARIDLPGAYNSTVGIVSLGEIGRLVCERLKSYDLRVLAYDPYATAERAAELGVELVALDDLFARCDVVSLHTPWLPETEGLITGEHIRSMRPNASFINTARGAVVREGEMIEALRDRGDLQAVLDVTWPEPPAADSPLWELENVVLTPHIAGSVGPECRRMARYMIEELSRYLTGEPLHHEVTRETAARMA